MDMATLKMNSMRSKPELKIIARRRHIIAIVELISDRILRSKSPFVI